MIFFIGTLETHLVGLNSTMLPSIPLLRKEEVPFEVKLIGKKKKIMNFDEHIILF
jgi:hypothetical protein